MRPTRALIAAAILAAATWAQVAAAIEYRAVSVDAAILYDAPSRKAHKLSIVGRNYPLEVVVALDGWTKVRDATGELSWIDAGQVDARRTVLVRVPRAQVRQAADESSLVVFEVEQDVVLEVLGMEGNFVHVKHADGSTGFVRITQVWGV